MILTGTNVSARKAQRIGLIASACTPACCTSGRELALELAKGGSRAAARGSGLC
jgi:enoyl-CoA hydratase/carnithine racemase